MEKLTWNDIVIIGDSFCAQRHNLDTWPRQLVAQLTKIYKTEETPRGHGYPGGSWWVSRKRLLNELSVSVPKLLVMCHTDHQRLPNYKDFSINGATAFDKTPGNDYVRLTQGDINVRTWNFLNGEMTDFGRWEMPKIFKPEFITKEEIEAVKQYYLHLSYPTYNRWAQLQWFKELDEIITHFNIPMVIHLHCFENDYCFRTGITSQEILFKLQSHGNSLKNIVYNHFTIEENGIFANQLYNAITNYDPADAGTVKNFNLLRTN
jgi:hypothetical protein